MIMPSSTPVEPPRKIVETEAPLVEAFQVALLEPRQLWQHQPHLVAGASRHPSQCPPVPAGSDRLNLVFYVSLPGQFYLGLY